MRFEKWQALGNDYLILEGDALPCPLTAARVTRAVRPPPRASEPTACCCSSAVRARGFVARLRIFNPDGSEAELSGNGAREAMLYLRRRGWTDSDVFSIETAAGEIRAADHRPRDLPRRHGPRPARRRGRRRRAAGRDWRYQHVVIGNPQTAIRVATEAELDASTSPRPDRRSRPTRASPTARTSRSGSSSAPDRIRARIWERGVGETLLLGHRRLRRGRRPRRCAAATRRSPSCSTAVSSRSRSGRTSTSRSPGWAGPGLRRHVDAAEVARLEALGERTEDLAAAHARARRRPLESPATRPRCSPSSAARWPPPGVPLAARHRRRPCSTPRRRRRSSSAGHLDTVPAQGNRPGRLDRRASSTASARPT